MNASLGSYRWTMPSASSFFEDLQKNAAQGFNTVVFHNQLIIPSELVTHLADFFQVGNHRPHTLDISARPDVDPLLEVNHALRVQGMPNLERLPQVSDTPLAVIVYGLGTEAGRAQAWAKLARDWAAHPLDGPTRNVLIVLCQYSAIPLPSETDRFKYMRWDKVVSALETSLCCRLWGEASRQSNPLQRWVEAMLSSLAPGDLALAERLWNPVCFASGSFRSSLCDYAGWRGWQEAEAARALESFSALKKQPGTLTFAEWWGRGWLINSAEYGFELHSALLALTDDGEKEIDRRVWRAQAALVLPAVDRLRSRLIERARKLIPNWRLADVIELGELESRLRDESGANMEVKRVKDDAYFARQIRNELAHYQPITFARYLELLNRDRE